MKWSEVEFNNEGGLQNSSPDVTLSINDDNKYQRIFGFGGAFSDVTGYHITRLSQPTQEQLMR